MHKKVFREYKSFNYQQNDWGLRLKNAGYTQVLPGETYPGTEHPDEYYFTWNKGRVLREYQMILISQGVGEFESDSCQAVTVKEGSVILLFKNEWHRYRPDHDLGWQEYWFGFDGWYADHIFNNSLLNPKCPIIVIPNQAILMELFQKTFEWLESYGPGNEKVVTSHLTTILAVIETILRSDPTLDAETEQKVKKYQVCLVENFDQEINLSNLASELGISYSWLRKKFRQQFGLAPNQYIVKLRIQKARDLLTLSNKSVKEIAVACGFSSPYYFSRYFKKETGVSPQKFRSR